MNEKAISQYLSFILRHKPEEIGLEIDVEGWADISHLIQKSKPVDNTILTKEIIEKVVINSDKNRFQISEDGRFIRAVQGHSNEKINRTFIEKTPPEFLYHGTAERFLTSIQTQGLIPKERQHVHLTENLETATSVGARYGAVKILKIDTLKMQNDGFKFYQAENGVWLVKSVPPKYFYEL